MDQLPDRIHVAFADPGQWPNGQPVRDGYVETFWTPILGPGAVMIARRLAYRISVHTDRASTPLVIDVNQLGMEVGLRQRGKGVWGRTGALRLSQLIRHGLADYTDEVFHLEAKWPLVSETQAAQLPASLSRFARPPTRVTA